MANIYVDPINGNDANDGSSFHPKQTLNGGVNAMAGGDTLNVKPGNYHERLNTNSIPSGPGPFSTASTTIKKWGLATDPNPVMFGNLWISVKSNIIWDGIDINGIENGIPTGDGNQETFTNVYINGGTNIRIENCEIFNASKLNVLTHDGNGPLSTIEFLNLNVHDPGQGGWTSGVEPANHNFYISAHFSATSGILINGCEISRALGPGNNSWGVQVYSSDPGFLNGVIVRNNFIHDNLNGIVAGSGPNHQIYNNVVYNNGVGGDGEGAITVSYGTGVDNIQIYNNTIYGNPGVHAIDLGRFNTPINTIIKNNIFWSNGFDDINVISGTGTVQSNNLTSNPLFVVPGVDFHLQSGSAAIGAGVNLSSVFTKDKDGISRPASPLPWTIGAYEGPATSGGSGGESGSGGGGGGGTTPPPTGGGPPDSGGTPPPGGTGGTGGITFSGSCGGYVLQEDTTSKISVEDLSGFILQEGTGTVWPIRLFAPLVIKYECANTIIPLGDGNERHMNKNQAYVHANGQGSISSHKGRWAFDITLAAIEHANADPNKEVNQLWRFINARMCNWSAFYFYNPMENPTIDCSGSSPIGRYLVRMVDPAVTLENFVLRLHRGSIQLIEVRA